jgi:MYXO-CTERM domain-containing protein
MRPASSTAPAALGLLCLGLAAAPARAQGLNGQPVGLTFRQGATGPTSAPTSDAGTQTVSPAGAMFASNGLDVTVTPTQIRFVTPPNSSAGFGAAPGFFGFRIAETGAAPAPIIGFLVDPATNVPGFDLSRVSGDPTDLYANLQGLSFDEGQNVTLDIFTAPPAVPEASTTASLGLLLALGLGGIALARRRRVTG